MQLVECRIKWFDQNRHYSGQSTSTKGDKQWEPAISPEAVGRGKGKFKSSKESVMQRWILKKKKKPKMQPKDNFGEGWFFWLILKGIVCRISQLLSVKSQRVVVDERAKEQMKRASQIGTNKAVNLRNKGEDRGWLAVVLFQIANNRTAHSTCPLFAL